MCIRDRVCGSAEYPIIKHLPNVEFILFDKTHTLQSWLAVRKQLVSRRFDALLLMQYSLLANVLSALIQAPHRIGFRYPRSHELHHFFINYQVGHERQHIVDTLLDFIAVLGAEKHILKPVRCYTDTELESVKQYIIGDRKILLISPCASEEVKQWSDERYAAVADYAIKTYGMQVILSGDNTQNTQYHCKQIKKYMTATAIDLAGKTNLSQFCALISCADLVLSPDSAAVHVASAVGTPAIGLLSLIHI